MMLMLRATHDALMAVKDETIVNLKQSLTVAQQERERAIATHDAFVALIAERVTPPVPRQMPAPKPKREPDAVDTAIQFVARGNGIQRNYLVKWAEGERRAGRDPADIAKQILHGERTAGESDDDAVSPSS